MSDNFVNHKINFPPAEGLKKNGTSIHVFDDDDDDDDHITQTQIRAAVVDSNATVADIHERQKLTEEMRKDPAYRFLMQVSAFTRRRINKLTDQTPIRHFKVARRCDLSSTACSRDGDKEQQWMQIPEISGVVLLSADVYGHIKEAEMIVNNFIHKPLKILVEHPRYQTLFARLVAIRMSLSSSLVNSHLQKDKTFVRLHQEQSMVLRALVKVQVHNTSRRWTEPGY